MRRPWDQAVAADIMDRVAIDGLCWALGREHNSFTGAQFANLTRRALENLQRAADEPPLDAEPRPAVAIAVRRNPAAGASLMPSARSTSARCGVVIARSRGGRRRRREAPLRTRMRSLGASPDVARHEPTVRPEERRRINRRSACAAARRSRQSRSRFGMFLARALPGAANAF